MGKTKRKNSSPLMKDSGKTRKTVEEEILEEVEETDNASRGGTMEEMITDLKKFIQKENAASGKSLAEQIRKSNEERMTALEASLTFALEANETLAKRLVEVEQRAEKAEKELRDSSKRMAAVEEQLDQLHQRQLLSWLIFCGPVIPRRTDAGNGEDTARLLCSMVRQFMGYTLHMEQIGEIQREQKQIRVRFNEVGGGSDRHFLLRHKTRLRGSGLYIREWLTPFRQNIFQELMQLKRNHQISTAFTRDGIAFVIVSQRDRPRPIRTLLALERLIQALSEPHGRTRAPEHQHRHADDTEAAGSEDADVTVISMESGRSQQRDRRAEDLQDGGTEVGVDRRRAPSGEVDGRQAESSSAAAGPHSAAAGPTSVSGGSPDAADADGPPSAAAAPRSSTDELLSAAAGSRSAAGELRSDAAGAESAAEVSRPAGTAAESRSYRREEGLTTGTSGGGLRRRYGGDIRRYASVNSGHSKCD